MFSFELIKGDPDRALQEPHQVVLTESTAESLFSGKDPLGETISIRLGETNKEFTISGIMRNIPGASSLRFHGILPYSQVFDAYQIDKNNNDFVNLPMFTTTLMSLATPEKAASLRTKLPAFNNRLYGPMWESVKMEPPKQGFDLLRFSEYHLGDVGVNSFVSRGYPAFSLILSGIALLVLVLACVNSLNLALAQGSTRLKEVGVRKVIGARASQLSGQFLTETFMTGLGSKILGLFVASLLVYPFNAVTGKNLAQNALFHPQTILIVLAAVLAVSMISGLIPAISLARSPAGDVFRGRFRFRTRNRLSLSLIIFQFVVSLFFIIGTLVITRQLHFMTSTDLGYDPSGIILVHTQVPGERAQEGVSLLERYRGELQNDSRVLAVSADSGSVGTHYGSVTRRYDQDGVERMVEAFMISHDFTQTLNIPVLEGRGFSREREYEAREGVLVNESFVREFELQDPVGKRFSDFAVDKLPPEYTFDPVVIGVVRDFHVLSLHEPIGPMAWGPEGFPPIQRFRNILVKARAGEEPGVLESLEKIWAGIRPELPFSATFLEDALAWDYRRERDWGRIVGWSAGFALFIACMGLFGLTAVIVVRRTKETGIRKVLGAGAPDILLLFSKDFLRWILIANLIAGPIALIAARKWLNGFAYRIDIQIWMFALAAVISLLIAALAMSFHAVKAAVSDPVASLRYE